MNSKPQIIPAIVPRDFKELADKLGRLEGLVEWAQIDIADGLFAPNITWENAPDLLQLDGKIKLEVHLMIEQPELYLAEWQKVVDRIIVHPEATAQLPQILKQLEHSPVKLGLALLLETPLETLAPYFESVKLIQLMSIAKIGHQGEPFAPAALERVRRLRELAPSVTISVDGGVSLENAQALVAAGADHLVIGSAIWQSGDVVKTINELKLIANS